MERRLSTLIVDCGEQDGAQATHRTAMERCDVDRLIWLRYHNYCLDVGESGMTNMN
jgi:hypothetical protein